MQRKANLRRINGTAGYEVVLSEDIITNADPNAKGNVGHMKVINSATFLNYDKEAMQAVINTFCKKAKKGQCVDVYADDEQILTIIKEKDNKLYAIVESGVRIGKLIPYVQE